MPQLTTSLVTGSHTGAPSPTSASHVGAGSTTSASHVDDLYPTTARYVGGITLVTTIHINATSTTSIHHVGDDSLASTSHVESMLPASGNDIGGIEKPRHLRHKPKFLCRTYEGDHLTFLCPSTARILEVWASPKSPLDSEAFVVSPHPVSPLINMTIMPLQFSPDHTHVVKGYVSPIPIITHPLQPRIEEVVIPVPSLVNPTPLMEGDASFNHVVRIHDPTPSE
jgi:hypothetical protein